MIEITSLQQLTFLTQEKGLKKQGSLPCLEYHGNYAKNKIRDFYSDLEGNLYMLKLPESYPTTLYPHRNNIEGLLNAFKGHMRALLTSIQEGSTGSELSILIKRLQHHPEKIKSKLKYHIQDNDDLKKEQERLVRQAIKETLEEFVSENEISSEVIASAILAIPEIETDINNQLLKQTMLSEINKDEETEQEL